MGNAEMLVVNEVMQEKKWLLISLIPTIQNQELSGILHTFKEK
jgi:hypothetical protein